MNSDHRRYTRRLEFIYDDKQRDRVRSGALAREWAAQHPQIFDAKDLELALNQPSFHFFEWFAAIALHEATGHLSLLEKYACQNHPRKISTLKKVVGDTLLSWLCESEESSPDLFCYSLVKPDDWFFCEVKGNRDEMSDSQYKWCEQLYEKTGKLTYLLYLSKR